MLNIRQGNRVWTIIAAMATAASSSQAQPRCEDVWEPLGAGLSNRALAMTGHDDGTGPAIYVAGAFLVAGDAPALRIARWDGDTWTTLDRGVNGPIHSLLSIDLGRGPRLLAGGQFSSPIGGPTINRIAAWSASQWSPLGAGMAGCQAGQGGGTFCVGYSSVEALASLDADGPGPGLAVVFAAGDFTSAGGVQAKYVAAWNGSTWTQVGGGVSAPVRALAVFDDGSGPALFAAGEFTQAGGITANRIAKWIGNTWAPLGSGIGGSGYFEGPLAMTVFDNGSGPGLYVAGDFTTVGGLPVHNIARWNGSAWSDVAGGVKDRVNAMAVFDDGAGPALYVAGQIGLAGGVPVQNIARWDGSTWSAPPGMNQQINSLAVFNDGKGPALYAAGEFTTAGGQPANRIARLTCRARGDANGDRRIDIADLIVVISNWSIPPTAQGCAGARPCPADLNGDGLVGAADLRILLSNWTP